MASSLGSIVLDLRTNTSAFIEGLTTASSAAKKAGRDIADGFSTVGNLAQAALAPLGELGSQIALTLTNVGQLGSSAARELASLTGGMSGVAVAGGVAVGVVGAVAGGTIALSLSAAASAASMYTLAQSAGLSVESLSKLAFGAKQVGVSRKCWPRACSSCSRTCCSRSRAAAREPRR